MPKRVMSAKERDLLGPSREHCVSCGEADRRVAQAEQVQAKQDKIDLALADSEEAIVKAAESKLAGDKVDPRPVRQKKLRREVANDASS